MSDINEVVDKVMSKISGTNVEAIFGESRQMGDKIVIPVGKVAYGWGAGGGSGKALGQEQEGEGMGLGMGVKVTPIGYITVTPDTVRYDPIFDLGPVMVVFSAFLALLFLKFFKVASVAMVGGKCPVRGAYPYKKKERMHRK